jgi:putative pyruvate formate lyase activating enzyme
MTGLKDVVLERASNPPAPQANGFEPAYLRLLESGELGRRVEQAMHRLEDCDLCARYCHVDREQSIRGAVCRTGEQAVVHSFGPHHGEEDCLRGRGGSGTIFFSWCCMRCVYCQNWEIAWEGRGEAVTDEALAGMMLDLQAMGCHNINLVTPSHVVAQILAAVEIAAGRGLRLPLVFNTGGYDSLEALALLDGVVDIYLPDMKYGDSELARKYSHVRHYVRHNQLAVREMHRQVGELAIDEDGVARRGLLVRHLILPHGIAGTAAVLRFLAEEVSPNTYVNLMDQYQPCFRAHDHPKLSRSITASEREEALELAQRFGIQRLDHRRATW